MSRLASLRLASLLLASTTLASIALARPAAAQEEAPSDARVLEARTLFLEGVEMSGAERWAEALDRFRRSAAIVRRPSTLFNIAIALHRLGRVRETIDAVDEYLAISDAAADATDRAEAVRLRLDALERLAHLTLRVRPPEAALELDGEPLEGEGEVREAAIDPGTHTLVARAPGHEEQRQRFEAAPGARLERLVELAPSESAPAEQAAAGRLVIDVPDDARVYVDGEEIGLGPASLEVEARGYTVRIAGEGYEPLEEEVAVRGGETTRFAPSLPRRAGGSLLEDPVFWAIAGGVALAAGVGIGVGVYVATEPQPYGGTLGTTITLR